MAWSVGADGTLQNEQSHRLANPERDSHKGKVWAADFSPDGRRLLLIMGGEVRMVDWPGRALTERGVLWAHSFPCGLAFSPVGTELATCGINEAEGTEAAKEGYRIRFWSLEGNRFKQKASFATEHASRVEYALGGEGILTQEEEWACVLRDKATGKVRWRWKPPAGATAYALAPDGRHVVIGNDNGTVYIVRLKEHAGR